MKKILSVSFPQNIIFIPSRVYIGNSDIYPINYIRT